MGVHIGARLQQHLRHLHSRRGIQGRQIRTAAARHGIEVDRVIKRGTAPKVPPIDIRLPRNQIGSGIEPHVQQGEIQRRRAIRVRQIDVRVPLEQLLDALDAAFAGRIQHRSESAMVLVLRTSLGRYPALPVTHQSTRIDISTL